MHEAVVSAPTAYAAPVRPLSQPPPRRLAYTVCETLDQAEEAWSLVYNTYVRHGLIPSNPHGIHLYPQALLPNSGVIVGQVDGTTISTMTVCGDSDQKLPLDDACADELNRLRDQGRRLLELGLFADRREGVNRCRGALLEMLRYACHFGVATHGTDAVIGVHPRHASFYIRLFGFEVIGPVRAYATVNGRPLVPLHLDWQRLVREPDAPKGIVYARNHPVDHAITARRFQARRPRLVGSTLQAFLSHRHPQSVESIAA